VREAIVVAQEETPGNKQLNAYVTLQRNNAEQDGIANASQIEAPTLGQLRDYLASRLPSYMVPSALVALDRLPLTANGKIDRQALPAPEERQTRVSIAPRTSAEKVIAAIWNDVLGRENSVGAEDNFFEIGGHSLLATQVVSRVRNTFRAEELPLVQIFQTPTVFGLVAALGEILGGDQIVEGIAEAILEMEGLSPEQLSALVSQAESLQEGPEVA